MKNQAKNIEKSMGFLLFYDWYDLFSDLPAKHVKMLLQAMIDYQRYGIEPPEFPDKIKKITNLIFVQLDRRLRNAENGRLGGEAKARREKENAAQSISPLAPPLASAGELPTAPPVAYRRDETRQEKIRQEKTSQDKSKQENKYLLSDESAYLCGSGEPQIENCKLQIENEDAETRNALAEREEKDFFEEKDAFQNDLKAYGKHKNVFLSDGEYRILKKDIPSADDYINTFSEKLFTKGYRYRDHYAALLSWWKRDKDYADRQSGFGSQGSFGGGYSDSSSDSCSMSDDFFDNAAARSLGMTLEEYRKSCEHEDPSNGSFDTDRFFEAAVRRALEED